MKRTGNLYNYLISAKTSGKQLTRLIEPIDGLKDINQTKS